MEAGGIFGIHVAKASGRTAKAKPTKARGVGVRECARQLGVSHSRIVALVNEGRIHKLPDGTLDVDAVREAFAASTDPSQSSKINPKESGNFARLREGHLAVRIQEAQLLLEVRKGKYVEAAPLYQMWNRMIANATARLLAIPDAEAVKLASENNPTRIRAHLRDVIDRALSDVSKWQPEIQPK